MDKQYNTSLELTRPIDRRTRHGYVSNGGANRAPNAFHCQYDRELQELTQAIVEAVAFIKNTAHEELSPLETVIDTDALTECLETSSEPVEVVFTYEELEITVTSDGDIWLQWA